MKITQIRNATLIIEYNGTRFLIDPWLGPKDYMPGFEPAINSQIRQPRVELPCDIKFITDVDAVIITHVHPDHWDDYAKEAIKKEIPIFVQSEDDKNYMLANGFKNVTIIDENGSLYSGIKLHKTRGQHGKREIVEDLCKQVNMPYDAMGVIFKAEKEKTLYLAGDTIWCIEVEDALKTYQPEVIIVNACAATLLNGEKIIMGIEDVNKVIQYAPGSRVIASHMDTVSHLSVTRKDLKEFAEKNGIKNLIIPDDGETIELK